MGSEPNSSDDYACGSRGRSLNEAKQALYYEPTYVKNLMRTAWTMPIAQALE